MPNWLETFGKPTTDKVNHPSGFFITSSQQSLVVSILSAGTFFGKLHYLNSCFVFIEPNPTSQGALAAAPVADHIGRKWGLILSTIVFDIGVAMQTASTSLPLFVVGRVFAGLGVGLVSCLVPMYQSEW